MEKLVSIIGIILIVLAVCAGAFVLYIYLPMNQADSLSKIADQMNTTSVNHFPDKQTLVCELTDTLSSKDISSTENKLTLCVDNFTKMFPEFKIINTLEVNSKEQFVIFEIGKNNDHPE